MRILFEVVTVAAPSNVKPLNLIPRNFRNNNMTQVSDLDFEVEFIV